MDIAAYNRKAWDQQVVSGNRWTVPVTSELIAAARAGNWSVVLTPQKPVPTNWFVNFCGFNLSGPNSSGHNLSGLKVLGLASGGGQQAPILSAAGAKVTVFDNSQRQLEQDQLVAQRDGLEIETVLGDMRDLSCFPPETFDLVFNPCSVSFIPQVQTMFDEVYRVLRPGGIFMGGFINPVRFIFDEDHLKRRQLSVRHKLPYTDETHLSPSELEQLASDGEPFMFSHSLEELIAGQLRSGFVLRDLFEDRDPPADDALSEFLPTYFATLAEKPFGSLTHVKDSRFQESRSDGMRQPGT